ncbi:MAG: pirin family protein [Gammaproteobacteria bacterium]|nr:pirin family protein [Gammaproteobacteria bacterium]MCP5458355.1 pirin family protein [Gammaproteobacteria bacterium]
MSTPIAHIIEPQVHDLGGFTVRRLLPALRKRMVGPFIFFDHLGPAEFAPGTGIDVRPHPHIGLATVTYLFEGDLVHRDSLGFVQTIRPGDVNWMVAGKGIVHSERTGPETRARGFHAHGIQSWIALPQADEEVAPDFRHHPAATLPVIEQAGVRLTLIAGSAFGQRAPAATYSPMFYLDGQMNLGDRSILPPEYSERAVYLVDGAIAIGDAHIEPGHMVIFSSGQDIDLRALKPSTRFMLLGGEPLDGTRYIWWNFVSSSKPRIEQAKVAWATGKFAPVPGESEFIPLPDD